MKRPSKSDIGNMDWQARSFGYAAAQHPTGNDIDMLVAQMPAIRFSASQRQELLGSAEYAYMMRLKHHAS